MLTIKPGQELIHKESNLLYIVKNVKHENVILVSKDGEAGMCLHQKSIALSAFDPVSELSRMADSMFGESTSEGSPKVLR